MLKRCYRNSKPVLVAAHALGFGIYRAAPQPGQTGLVQMFDHPLLWEEVGYVAEDGELREGSRVRLVRPETTSPGFLAEHSPLDDLIHFRTFTTEQEQAAWVAQEIRDNLQREDLRHGDIVVINPDPRTTRGSVGIVRALLLDMDIQSHLAGVDTNPDTFYLDGESVTFSGIHRAKGNEAAMVYIINAHDCQSAAFDLARIRNRLFTAMTRSKAWVRVLGIGGSMDALTREYEALKAQNFSLDFHYPSTEERERLRVIHRDMTEADRKRVRDSNQELGRLVRDLEHGNVRPEDLDENDSRQAQDPPRGRAMTPQTILDQINRLVRHLVETGLADDQRSAFRRGTGVVEVTFDSAGQVSAALGNTSYAEIYEIFVRDSSLQCEAP